MIKTKTDLLNELIHKQKKDVYYAKKLTYRDMNRIVKYIDKPIFGNECSIWLGYISCLGKDNNNYYINFFFRDKKVGLHRLLYSNFVGNIESNEYIRFSCENQGKCCNINHFIKYSSNDNNSNNSDDDKDDNTDNDDDGDRDRDNGDNKDDGDDKKDRKKKDKNKGLQKKASLSDFTVTF